MGVFACGSYCNFSYKYITKTFQLVFLTFGSNLIILFRKFLDISFAWQRVKSFSLKKNDQKNFKKHLICMFIAAIILIAPSFIITSVEPIGILRRTDQNQSDEILYSIATAKFVQIVYCTYGLLALNLFNGFILYNILVGSLPISISSIIFQFSGYSTFYSFIILYLLI